MLRYPQQRAQLSVRFNFSIWIILSFTNICITKLKIAARPPLMSLMNTAYDRTEGEGPGTSVCGGGDWAGVVKPDRCDINGLSHPMLSIPEPVRDVVVAMGCGC